MKPARRITIGALFVGAVLLEILAFNLLTTAQAVASFVAIHLAASLLAALALQNALPPSAREPAAIVIGAIGAFSFFIPGGGLVAVAAATALMVRDRRRLGAPFKTVQMPELGAPQPAPTAGFRAAGLRDVLLDASQPSPVRLRSLRVLQSIPMRQAGPVLTALLDDPLEDLRLSAHALLERAAKRVAGVIHTELERLPGHTERAARLVSLRRIAEHYWELVYAGLATGDTATFAIAQGIKYADAALTLAPGDAALWLLRGRLLQAMHDPRGARQSIQTAIGAGLAPERGAAYLAELAFERGDFRAVREQIARIESEPGMTLGPVAQFWQIRSRPRRARVVAA